MMATQPDQLSITPAHPHFGARVEGIHLPDLRADDRRHRSLFAQLVDALQDYSVLTLPDQDFTDHRQMEFTRQWFGELEIQVGSIGTEASRNSGTERMNEFYHAALLETARLTDASGAGSQIRWQPR